MSKNQDKPEFLINLADIANLRLFFIKIILLKFWNFHNCLLSLIICQLKKLKKFKEKDGVKKNSLILIFLILFSNNWAFQIKFLNNIKLNFLLIDLAKKSITTKFFVLKGE